VQWLTPRNDGGEEITNYRLDKWYLIGALEGDVETHDILVEEATVDAGSPYSHEIKGLVQSSSNPNGFGVRVLAGNSQGFGPACPDVSPKPMAAPDPPAVVELARDTSCASSLII